MNFDDSSSNPSDATSIQIDRSALIDPVSFEPFDVSENYPVALPCGHTLSALTFETLKRGRDLKCPQCRHIFSDHIFYSRNVIISNILKQPKKVKCPEHMESVKRACLTCYKPLCIDCMTNHSGHDIVKLKDLRQQMMNRVESLENSQCVRESDIQSEIENFVDKTISIIQKELKSFAKTFFEKNKVPAFSQSLERKVLEILQSNSSTDIESLKLIKNWDEECQKIKEDSEQSTYAKNDVLKKLNDISTALNLIIKQLLYPGELKIEDFEEYQYFIANYQNETSEKMQEKLVSFRSFSLNTANFKTPIEDQELRKFSMVLKNLPSLMTLNLQLCSDTVRNSSISNKGIIDLASCIKRFKQMKELHIDLSSSSQIKDEGFIELFEALNAIAPTATKLSLTLRKCGGLTDKALKSLAQSLTGFKQLEKVHLDFQECGQISDRGLIEICQSLKDLSQLKAIGLQFGAGLLDSSQISDEGLNQLSETLKSLSALSEMNLQFTCSDRLTDKSMIQLSESLNKLAKLTKVHLELCCCPMISDKSLIEISNSLKTLKSIHELTLEFSGCTQIGDDSLKELSLVLRQMSTLNNLTLGFVGCKQATSRGIAELYNATDNLPFLASRSLTPNRKN